MIHKQVINLDHVRVTGKLRWAVDCQMVEVVTSPNILTLVCIDLIEDLDAIYVAQDWGAREYSPTIVEKIAIPCGPDVRFSEDGAAILGAESEVIFTPRPGCRVRAVPLDETYQRLGCLTIAARLEQDLVEHGDNPNVGEVRAMLAAMYKDLGVAT